MYQMHDVTDGIKMCGEQMVPCQRRPSCIISHIQKILDQQLVMKLFLLFVSHSLDTVTIMKL